jgi:Raf kinase inhibitor-like YbhB/YbcL family protein
MFPKHRSTVMQRCGECSFLILMVLIVIACGCTSPAVYEQPAPAESSPSSTQQTATMPAAFSLSVGSIPEGGVLPERYTCKGASESPGVSWDGIPAGTKSLVLILEDPDAPAGTFTHWIVYNIPPQEGRLSPAQTNAKVLPGGAQQGDSSSGSRGYYPPCPPVGTKHRYIFRLFAVNMDITQPTADRDSIDWALNGHTIAKTVLTTTVTR